jgi:hypothetical protein
VILRNSLHLCGQSATTVIQEKLSGKRASSHRAGTEGQHGAERADEGTSHGSLKAERRRRVSGEAGYTENPLRDQKKTATNQQRRVRRVIYGKQSFLIAL